MNINDLKNRIRREGLTVCKYNVDFKPMRHDEIGLLRTNEIWEVYQSQERGGFHIIESFDNEEDACEMIYKFLVIEKKGNDRMKQLKQNKR